MFERIDYRVIRIDGEYAYLQKLEDENAEEKCVAMALLLRRFRRAAILHMR